MEKSNKGNKELLKPVAIILLLLLIGFIFNLKNKYYLYQCSKYTIGKYSNIYSSRQGKSVSFYYKVNSIILEVPLTLKNEDRVKEKLIYLRYVCNNPEIIEGIWDKKVDSVHLKNLPAEGWDRLPE